MPAEKNVEQRRQTQHKLELMERYWGAWCMILAQATTYPFCPTHLWLVDTHAGPGRHDSAADPDGHIEGTPALAALAARAVQRRFPGVTVHVRATDKQKSVAERLFAVMKPLTGDPPEAVDFKIAPRDWVSVVPWVQAEIAKEDHPHGGRPGPRGRHDHRSLWFIDPFGVESIDHKVIEGLPVGAEVIVNLDLMGALRDAGKARKGDAAMRELLRTAFGSDAWEAPSALAEPHQALADAFANTFPRWRYRNAYLLRATGSQDRAMVHLTDAKTAVPAFARAVKDAMRAGTVIAGRVLSAQQKDDAAVMLFNLFAGRSLTAREMAPFVPRYSLDQVRTICRTADQNRYGRWDEKAGTMEWFAERVPEKGLFD